MDYSVLESIPTVHGLPPSMSRDGSISLELEQGIAVFRASSAVIDRIEGLLQKQRTTALTVEEENELDQYEEIDDYLSFVNRLLRNFTLARDNSRDGIA